MDASDIIRAGQAFFQAGLITAASGNLSIRNGKKLLITKTGCGLGKLTENDLVETGIFEDDETSRLASSELTVHREIYKITDALAIAHAHPLHATALSCKESEILPAAPEILKEIGAVPVVGEDSGIHPGAYAGEIAESLKTHKMVMVRGHGSFAAAKTMEEACRQTILFEEDCRKHRPTGPGNLIRHEE